MLSILPIPAAPVSEEDQILNAYEWGCDAHDIGFTVAQAEAESVKHYYPESFMDGYRAAGMVG